MFWKTETYQFFIGTDESQVIFRHQNLVGNFFRCNCMLCMSRGTTEDAIYRILWGV